MFLIVNNEVPLRSAGSSVMLGVNEIGEFALNPAEPMCRLFCNALGEWFVAPVGDTEIEISQVAVTGASKVTSTDLIRIGRFTIGLRFHEQGKVVAPAIREKKQYQLLSDLHLTVMEIVSASSTNLSAQVYRQRVEAAIDKALSETKLEPELEDYLAFQAAHEILMDDIHGYGNKRQKTSLQRNLASFTPLIDAIKKIIRLNPNETATQKAERVELLLHWGLEKRRDALAPHRHTLAIGLLGEQLSDIIFGLGPLEDLMVAGDVNDIMVLPSGKIYLDRNGRMMDSGRMMASPRISNEICQRIVGRVGRRLDQTSPMVDARLSDGSRLNAVIEPISLHGPTLIVRRFPQERLTVNDLIEKETFSKEIAAFLRACVIARMNIVISGGTGSGKTTLINTLASFIPAHERIVTIEDTAELQLIQEHVVTMQARLPNLEGKGAIPIRALVRNALRMRPDRIIVGEVRDEAAIDMLQAMNTGHDGSLTTLHARSPRDAVLRLEVMSLEAKDLDLPSRAIREIIAAATDLIIQIERLPHGARRVTSISEVVEFDETDGVVVVEEIFKLAHHRKRQDNGTSGLEFTGYVPTFMDQLAQLDGITIDSLF